MRAYSRGDPALSPQRLPLGRMTFLWNLGAPEKTVLVTLEQHYNFMMYLCCLLYF